MAANLFRVSSICTYLSYNYDRMTGDENCVRECVNHFEFHKEITTKNGFIKNLKKYGKLNIINPF